MKNDNVLYNNQMNTENISKQQLDAILEYTKTLNERIKKIEKQRSSNTD